MLTNVCQMRDLVVRVGEMPYPKTGKNNNNAQLILPDNICARVGCLQWMGCY